MNGDALRRWADRLMETKPFNLVAVATANTLRYWERRIILWIELLAMGSAWADNFS